MPYINSIQQKAMNAFNPKFTSLGINLGDMIEQLGSAATTGGLGITATADAVDSVALNASFARDPSTDSGLTFGYAAGLLWNGKTYTAVAAGAIALSASALNYIEVSRAGVVSKNTAGFTSGKVPLYTVLTGGAGFTEANVTHVKPLIFAPPNGGISGDLLSAMAATKEIVVPLPTPISATGSYLLPTPGSGAAALARFCLGVTTTIGTDNSNYWTVAIANGATAMLAASDANTTKATGGAAFTANTARQFTVHGTTGNLATAADDMPVVTYTKTGAPGNIVGGVMKAEYSFLV